MPTEQLDGVELIAAGLTIFLVIGGVGAVACAVQWVINEVYGFIFGRKLWPDMWK